MLRVLLLMVALTGLAAPAWAGGGPAETVVVVNEASADSLRVGAHYAQARDLPPGHVLRVRCSTELTVPIEDFVRDVVDPVRAKLHERGLTSRCRFLVLTQGMPIRAKTPGNHVSTAAVLSLLDSPIAGQDQGRMPRFPNPYRSGVAPRAPLGDFGRPILVTALLSTTAEEAIALVDRSVASDGTRPKKAHFVFQDANGNANVRNGQYDAAREVLEKRGHTSEHVAAGPEVVTGRKRVIGYMSGGSYSRLDAAKVGANAYLPGAVCDMLQSYGAVPPNFLPGRGQQFPITHMVRAGITGVHGCVAEPYTIAFSGADLFAPYVEGYTLAESFHQKLPHAYWMNLVLGDPLCAPFADRPLPVVRVNGKNPGTTPLEGEVELTVRADGGKPVRYEAFVDGAPAGSFDGSRGKIRFAAAAFPPGEHQLLVQATGKGDHEPCGWSAHTIVLTGGAAAEAAPTGSAHPIGSLVVEGPRSIVAGESVDVRVGVRDASGAPLAGWKGLVEVRSTRPPVRWVSVRTGHATDGLSRPFTLSFPKAGTMALTVTLPEQGLSHEHSLEVRHGSAHHVTTPLSTVPRAQVIDLPFVVEDRLGNPVLDYDGTIALEAPDALNAVVPEPVPLTKANRGRGVLRDVLLDAAGTTRLVFRDRHDAVVSQQGEGVRLQWTAIRAWLLGTPLAPADVPGFSAEGANHDGAVCGPSLFRRHRATRDEILFPSAGTRDGFVGVAVTHLRVHTGGRKVALKMAAPGPVRVLLDGKPVFDGTPKSADARKPAAVAQFTLSKGRHRVTVFVTRQGRFAFTARLDAAEAGQQPAFEIVANRPAERPVSVLSGSVRSGRKPIAGVKVGLTDADGKAHETVTNRQGEYWFEGISGGSVRIAPAGPADDFRPREHAFSYEGGVATGRDFAFVDRTPPTVAWPDLGNRARFGRRLRLEPLVDDPSGIREVRLLVDGKPAGTPVTAAPWAFDVETPPGVKGFVDLVAVAVDTAGNEAHSGPLRVQVVADSKPPSIQLTGLKNKATLKKVAVVAAKIRDDLGVAEVRFVLDGKPLAASSDSRGRPSVRLDPKKVGKGAHRLEVFARDTDGNEGSKAIEFRVR